MLEMVIIQKQAFSQHVQTEHFFFTWNIESFNESVLVALEVDGEQKASTLTKQMYLSSYSGGSFTIQP